MNGALATLAIGVGLIVFATHAVRHPVEAAANISRLLSGGRREVAANEAEVLGFALGCLGALLFLLAAWRIGAEYFRG